MPYFLMSMLTKSTISITFLITKVTVTVHLSTVYDGYKLSEQTVFYMKGYLMI